MQPRMKNPAMVIPEAMQAIQALNAATGKGGVPAATLALVHLRASQINGCGSMRPRLRDPGICASQKIRRYHVVLR